MKVLIISFLVLTLLACSSRAQWVRASPEVLRSEVKPGGEVFVRTHAGEEFTLKISQITGTLLIGLDAQDRSVQILIKDIALLEQKQDSNAGSVVGISVGTAVLYIAVSIVSLIALAKFAEALSID